MMLRDYSDVAVIASGQPDALSSMQAVGAVAALTAPESMQRKHEECNFLPRFTVVLIITNC